MVPESDKKVTDKKDKVSKGGSKIKKKPPLPEHDPKMGTLFIGGRGKAVDIEVPHVKGEDSDAK